MTRSLKVRLAESEARLAESEARAAHFKNLIDVRLETNVALSNLLSAANRKQTLEQARIGGVETVEVLRITYNRGEGVEGSPVRNVVEWWTKDGRRIAEEDPCKGGAHG